MNKEKLVNHLTKELETHVKNCKKSWEKQPEMHSFYHGYYRALQDILVYVYELDLESEEQ